MMADMITPVALVTGASRGIGRETALALGAKGLAVYLAADGAEAELQEGEGAARAAGAPEAAYGLFDLAHAGEAERMVEAALERFERIDVLVNNAGIRCRKAFGDYTKEDFDRVVSVNL